MTNEQEAFNTIWAGIKAQGCLSMNASKTRCAYRGKNGAKCAIGWLIPDDQYLPEFEEDSYNLAFVMKKVSALGRYNILFLDGMQAAHDIAVCGARMYGYVFMDEWKSRMRMYANKHGITVPE